MFMFMFLKHNKYWNVEAIFAVSEHQCNRFVCSSSVDSIATFDVEDSQRV